MFKKTAEVPGYPGVTIKEPSTGTYVAFARYVQTTKLLDSEYTMQEFKAYFVLLQVHEEGVPVLYKYIEEPCETLPETIRSLGVDGLKKIFAEWIDGVGKTFVDACWNVIVDMGVPEEETLYELGKSQRNPEESSGSTTSSAPDGEKRSRRWTSFLGKSS